MSIDSNILKIGALWLISIFYFLKITGNLWNIKFSKKWISVFLIYLSIVIHYLFIGYSITFDTNQILIYGLVLLILVLCIDNAIDFAILLKQSVLLFSIIATIFVLINFQLALVGSQNSFIDGNFVGVTANSNMLGAYVALCCFPLFFQCARTLKNRQIRYFSWALLIVCCYLIFLSRSRAALLAICVSSIFILVTITHLKRSVKLFTICTISIATVVAFIQASEKYSEIELLSTRSILLFQRITAISERPWFGWGFNSSVYNYYDDSNIFPAMEKGNTLLQAFEEFGVPFGSIILISLFYLIWRNTISLTKWRWGLGYSATLVGCAVHLMFETWMFNFPALLSIYFWMILLLAGKIQPPSRNLDNSSP